MQLDRIVRSLRKRGIAWWADRALSMIQERCFDLRYGTDTVEFVGPGALTIIGENKDKGNGYQPTRMRFFRRMMSTLNPPPGSNIVDFGCGKGRVLLLATEFGFTRVAGIEYAKELCVIARDNVARYRKKTGFKSDIRIVEGDAVNYEIQDDDTVFFMFNPFGAELIEKIVQNIRRSLTRKNRKVFIIYNNPLWQDSIARHGFTQLKGFNALECVVYSNVEGQ